MVVVELLGISPLGGHEYERCVQVVSGIFLSGLVGEFENGTRACLLVGCGSRWEASLFII